MAKCQAFSSYAMEFEIPVILVTVVLQLQLTSGIVKQYLWMLHATSLAFSQVVATT